VWLPGLFFAPDPHGTLSAQIWLVSLKLAASYLLAMIGWVLLLAWAAVLFARLKPLPENDAVTELCKRLCASRRWVLAEFCWILVFAFAALTVANILSHLSWGVWISMPLVLLLLVAGVVAQAGTMRSLLNDGEKRIRMVWGILSMLLWMATAFGVMLLVAASHTPVLTWVVGWVVVPAFFIPVVATSANWGILLPWRKLLRLVYEWRWWLGLIAALAVGVALPCLINAAMQSGNTTPSLWIEDLRACGIGLLAMGSWVLLLGWLAVLLARLKPRSNEALAGVPALAGPPNPDKEDSVKLPLPEND